jgi:hypothetical protein
VVVTEPHLQKVIRNTRRRGSHPYAFVYEMEASVAVAFTVPTTATCTSASAPITRTASRESRLCRHIRRSFHAARPESAVDGAARFP